MKKYIKLFKIIFVGSTLMFGSAHALETTPGLTVTGIVTTIGGGYLILSSAMAGDNSCNGPTNMLAYSNNTDGKAFLSVALVALTTGKKVTVYSQGTCAPHQPNLEEMSTLTIGQ